MGWEKPGRCFVEGHISTCFWVTHTHTHKKCWQLRKHWHRTKSRRKNINHKFVFAAVVATAFYSWSEAVASGFEMYKFCPGFFFFWLVTLMHRCRKFKVYIYPRDNHKSDSEWERTVLHVETSSIEFNELKTRVSFIKAFVKYYSTLVQHTSTFSLVASNSHWHLYKVSQHPATQLQVKPWLENVQINFKINLKFHHVLFISADQCFNQETPTLTQHRLN